MRIHPDPDPDLVRIFSREKLNFYLKNILKVGNRSKNTPTATTKVQKGRKTRIIGKLWYIFMLLEPDSHHSQYGSESGTAR